MALAVQGQVRWLECHGQAVIDPPAPITPDTPFELASTSKIFTAAAVMLLAEQGALELDAPAQAFVPEFGDCAITIRQLLSHTSGLEDYLAEGMFTPAERLRPEAVRQQLPNWCAKARPGRRFEYSNTNYVALAFLIEAASGMGYAQFLRQHLFRPAGMADSWVLGDDEGRPALARGYRNAGFGLPRWLATEHLLPATVGDGGVVSTLNDLLRWQACFLAGGVISKASLQSMASRASAREGAPLDYGLGLQLETNPGGTTWVGHAGSWVDSTCIMGHYRPADLTIIVLSNHFMAPVERIAQRALALYTEDH